MSVHYHWLCSNSIILRIFQDLGGPKEICVEEAEEEAAEEEAEAWDPLPHLGSQDLISTVLKVTNNLSMATTVAINPTNNNTNNSKGKHFIVHLIPGV